MRRLARTVTLWDEKAQAPIVLEAGTVPDEWAADQIPNPKAWAPEEESTPDGDGDGSGTSDESPEEPPREGTGSGVGAWRKYAKAIGVEVPKDAKRDEIIAAVDAAKDDDGDDEPVEPPREGEGSELEAWQEYAEAIGFDVPEDATREEIIAAIDADRENPDA